MLNIARNIKRLNLSRAAVACIACALILAPGITHAQNSRSNYTARGIATVFGGNISAARAAAISDAQQKIVLAALADQLTLEKLSSSFATLHNLFISQPDSYVQRFKILNETTLAGTHHILIEAFTEDALLLRDLESVGLRGPSGEETAALLMVAETSSNGRYASWWAKDPTDRILPLDVGSKMAGLLQERGFSVIDTTNIPVKPLTPPAGETFPEREAVFTAGSQAGADIIVLASADLKQTQAGSDFAHIQCDMDAKVLDLRKNEMVLQTSTNALGIHIDREAAACEAVIKACSRLADQISDKTLTAVKNTTQTYSFRCTFPGPRPESTSQDFFNLLRATLPEIVSLEVQTTANPNVRLAKITSNVGGAVLVQKTLSTQPGGYTLKLGMVEDTMINLTVTQPGTH